MTTTSESLAFNRGVRPMLEILLPGEADAVIVFKPILTCKLALKNSPENRRKAISQKTNMPNSQTTSAADRQLTSWMIGTQIRVQVEVCLTRPNPTS